MILQVGDLVKMPTREAKFGIKQIGLIVHDKTVRNRIEVFWSGQHEGVKYEPTTLLELISD